MKKLKNKFEKIVSLIMFISLIINIIPNAMASEVKYIEEAYVQRSISISEYDALNIKNEIGNIEEENPGEETKPDEGEKEDPGEETKPDEGEKEDPGEETKPDEFGTDKEPDEPIEIAKIDEQELRIHEKKPAQLPEMPEKNDEVIPQQEPNNITLERVNNNNTYEIPRTGDKNSTLLDIAMTLTIMSATLIAILSICKRKKQK